MDFWEDIYPVIIVSYVVINCLIAVYSCVLGCIIHEYFLWIQYLYIRVGMARPVGKVLLCLAFALSVVLEIPAMVIAGIVTALQILYHYLFEGGSFSEAVHFVLVEERYED